MARNQTLPYFPTPPQEYTTDYMNQLVLSFSLYMNQIQTPGEGRSSKMTLTTLQNHDQSLEVGGLFNHGGYVKITESNKPHPATNVGTGSVGSVTVTT
tara:strand:- start:19181 stop:19474 length:294 start_codon:yes stop_codon:yes gene_type:complete